jgi:3alpha(or 20beta)-hydroxysteroid dehydrogenase
VKSRYETGAGVSEGQLQGKTAIVTGGARGIGAAVSELFVSEGASVVIADLLEDEGTTLSSKLGDRATFVGHDVTDEASWERVLGHCTSSFGPPDVLVNNAGVMVVGPIEQATVADFTKAFSVNLIGAFLGIRTMIAPMREQGGGSIITLSSVVGYSGNVGMSAYAASKAGNIALVRSAAMELGPLGIRVNSIVPGGIDTPMHPGSEEGIDIDAIYGRIPAGRIGTAEEVASLALFLASAASSYVSGAQYLVDGGMSAGPLLF